MGGRTLLAALISVLAITGCRPPAAKMASAPAVTQGLKVGVQEITKGTIENRLTLSGVLAPSEQVMVMAKLPGKLIETKVREGQTVAKDELIALVNQDLPGQEFNDFQVKAPVSGVIAKVMVDPGSTVAPSVPIALIVNMDQLEVTVNVIESEISSVHKGLHADIVVPAYPERKFSGSVSNILPIVDPMSHTAKTEIRIPNPGHVLKPGMSATVRLTLGKHENVMIVPRDAIIEKMGERYVYLFSDGAAKRANVLTGFDDGKMVEVLSGANEGDKLVITDLSALKDGTKVRAREQ